MNSFVRSWRIFRRAGSLLLDRGALAAFPAVSFILLSAVTLSAASVCFYLLDLSFSGGKVVADDGREWTPGMIVCMLLICLVVSLTANFCNAAFYSEIFACLKGEEKASLSRGFRFAAGRILPLFLWSLLSDTVGLLLRMISGRNGRAWISRSLWYAWSVASCFAIPVIVCDPALINPFRALKHSASVINRTWGEALIGFAGLRILSGAGMAACALLVTWLWSGVRASSASSLPLVLTAGGGALLLGIFVYLVNAAETVYRATLFLYAEEGIFPPGFDSDDLNNAFVRE